ncbi:MAG: KpsF/GutQ family sugar-phosphate isomerase [Fimbriimonadaceae bacterium]|nr:KpsF/GutQ family sugar-phosphate isomerase [Fimbriimonadaceae bacterium]
MSLESLRRVLTEESQAILAVANRLDGRFAQAVEWILHAPGRVVLCGIGKSGHIARKTAGTFASTGTPSFFLHAAEAVHGDLGMVTRDDVVLLYTYSGETDEIVRLFPSFSAIGPRTILITGRPESSAGRLAHLVLDVSVEKEACPNNLAPTTSTTVMLAVSDALAVAVMENRGFGRDDFAKFHPSGALGKRLLLTVRDVMRTGTDLALVGPQAKVVETMKAISEAGTGAACVVEPHQVLIGFISDGDLRRSILHDPAVLHAPSATIMTTGVTTLPPDLLAAEALEVFQNLPRKIGEMPVVEEDGRVVGLLVLKDLLRAGIV